MVKQKHILLGAMFPVVIALSGCQASPQDVERNNTPEQKTQQSSQSQQTTMPISPQSQQRQAPEPTEVLANETHLVTIETNKGVITFLTYDADAPKASHNFVTLAQEGFYDGVIFHRAIDGFMIQGGDPTGTGAGGPGYQFEDELDPTTESYKNGYKKGVLAMANAGSNTNGSQFFIMVDDYPLPNNYTIFGHVVDGQEVADAIAKLPTTGTPSDQLLEEVVMQKVTVEKVK